MAVTPAKRSRATADHPEPLGEHYEQEDAELVDDIMLNFDPSVRPRELAAHERPANISDNQRLILLKLGCSVEELEAAQFVTDVAKLFAKYVDKPSAAQQKYLAERGVPTHNIKKKSVASAVIQRMKLVLSPTIAQKELLEVIFKRDKITTPMPADLTEFTASEFIDQLSETRSITDGQRKALIRFKVAVSELPCFFRQAEKLLATCNAEKSAHCWKTSNAMRSDYNSEFAIQ
jgi:hypothetical protein